VVAWRRHGRWLQVMDPAIGRRWVDCEEFLTTVYRHAQTIPADVWSDWASSEAFLGGLRRRMRSVGIGCAGRERFERGAKDRRAWGVLDAAVRMAQTLRHGGALPRNSAERLISVLLEKPEKIPRRYWSTEAD